ncbi:hypothetical protein ACH47Z_18230 [Streptomyces sp. NPDC020192]|uniref:hypothetical protein n=1 Tax=Streptomyces sp. NPDC020192 TaxID=3365066 RepID=UPI0037947DF3
MRTTTTVAVIAAALAASLTACSQAPETPASRAAAADARRACRAARINPGSTFQPNGQGIAPDDVDTLRSVKEAADWAADAAVRDKGWTSLADALSVAASQMRQAKAYAEKTGVPALAPDQEAFKDAVNTVFAACRRAYTTD